MIGVVFVDAGPRSSGPSVPVTPRTTPNNPPCCTPLADFWNGKAYFERSQYITNSQLQQGYGYDEPAPIARPDIGPNVIYLYYHTHIQVRDGAIGLAISYDGGASFTPYNGGLAVVPDGIGCDTDSGYVVMPSVVNHNGVFFMVYEGATQMQTSGTSSDGWPSCGNLGEIHLATSTDGVNWVKQGIILRNNLSGFECINIGGTFIGFFNNLFYVFYHGNCGAPGTTDNRSKIGMASGSSLASLTKYSGNPVMDVGVGQWSWDSRVNGRPSVVQEGSYYYMSFEGSRSAYCGSIPGIPNGDWGWGMARSTDLMHWEKYRYNPIRQTYNDHNCLNNNPYLFQFNGVTWVYQFDKGVRNVLLTGTGTCTYQIPCDPYLHVYPSIDGVGVVGQCQHNHNLGFLDGDGWAANTNTQNNGYMCFGPYETGLPAGKYAVSFENWIDSNTGDTYKVLVEDINDATNNPNGVVVSMDIHRNDFNGQKIYQDFEQQFQSVSGNSYEWRTWWIDISWVRQHFVAVRQLDGQNDITPPSASISSLPSNSAAPSFPLSWSGLDAQSGVMSYDIQYQDNGLGWTPLLQPTQPGQKGPACCIGTTLTSTTFSQSQCYHTYGFEVLARDYSGNVAGYSPVASTYIPCGSSNHLSNPGFETGDFSGWSQTGMVIRADAKNVHSGSYAAAAYYDPSTSIYSAFTLQQILATPVAGAYVTSIQLWYLYGNTGDNAQVLYADGSSSTSTNLPTVWSWTLKALAFDSTKQVSGIKVVRPSGGTTNIDLDDFQLTSTSHTLSNTPSSSDWKGQSGSWTLVNGYMDGSGTSAQLQSSANFPSDRTVSVRARTITAGGSVYKVAYLYGKYVDFYDKAYMYIQTDGTVVLAMWQGSTNHGYVYYNSGLSPYVWHTFTLVFSGNTAKAYVDGTLYITATDPILGALGGASIDLASWGPSESQFDSATIS